MNDPAFPLDDFLDGGAMAGTAPGGEQAAEPIFFAPHSADSGPPARRAAPLGPGIWEAVLWIIGFFLIEIAGAFAWTVGAIAYRTVMGGGGPAGPDVLQGVMPWMIGSIKLVEVIAALIAIRLRFGRPAFHVTGFRAIPTLHAVVLVFAIVPTAFLSGQCFALLHGVWDQLAEQVPSLRAIDELSSIEAVQAMAESTPLVFLVLIIAVLPALNEEFVFRAAIGRGLLGRYGLVAGIALTSMLFAAVHLSPVHAVALIPLAVLIHVGYLSSGSIWWAVIAHFLNNALSVALMKLATVAPEIGGMTADVTESTFSPLVFVAAAACVIATVWLLFEIRIRWELPDGRLWRAENTNVEPPPPGTDATPVVPRPPAIPLAIAAGTYVLFPIALVTAAMLGQL